jgi:hypothetical protein
MHCTKKAAEKAAKDEAIGYVEKHAVSTVLSFLWWETRLIDKIDHPNIWFKIIQLY